MYINTFVPNKNRNGVNMLMNTLHGHCCFPAFYSVTNRPFLSVMNSDSDIRVYEYISESEFFINSE